MKTLNYGEIPNDLTIDEPYRMELIANDEQIAVDAINQGIDAHLEAVSFNDHGVNGNKRRIDICDSKSMRCFLRRLVESGNDDAQDLASCIMTTLDFEWI